MSGINWKELELLLSEMPLMGSYVQKITEHSVHSFSIHFFSKEEKAWMMYCEISTSHQRVNRTEKLRKKSSNNQRFTQYLKAHIIGRRVVEVKQYPFDRAFLLKLQNSEDTINMIFRLYTGPGANVIITKEDSTIPLFLFCEISSEHVVTVVLFFIHHLTQTFYIDFWVNHLEYVSIECE